MADAEKRTAKNLKTLWDFEVKPRVLVNSRVTRMTGVQLTHSKGQHLYHCVVLQLQYCFTIADTVCVMFGLLL